MGCRVELNLTLSVVKVIAVAWPREETFVAPCQPVDNGHINDRQALEGPLVLLGALISSTLRVLSTRPIHSTLSDDSQGQNPPLLSSGECHPHNEHI